MKWLSIVLLSTLSLAAQQTTPSPSSTSAQASVRFSFDWLQGVPWQKYTIDVQLDGKSHFVGTPHPDETNDTDTVRQDFTMSDANRRKIFELAHKTNYFRGNFDARIKHIAQTGSKTLAYQSPELNGSTTYNFSQDPNIQQLTQFFEGVAMTIDCGRKLAFQYRFDKLGMDQRLKELEDLQTSHGVEELEIIAPILRKIASDPNMMNISRESARRLLETMNQAGMAAQTPAAQ